MKHIKITERRGGESIDYSNDTEVMDIRLITRQLEKIEGVSKVEGEITLLIDSVGMDEGEQALRAEFWIISSRNEPIELYTLEGGLIDAFPNISFDFHTIYEETTDEGS